MSLKEERSRSDMDYYQSLQPETVEISSGRQIGGEREEMRERMMRLNKVDLETFNDIIGEKGIRLSRLKDKDVSYILSVMAYGFGIF